MKKRAKAVCATCQGRFTARRADVRFCSAACRQRAHRLRSDDPRGLLAEIDATRRHYWHLVAELGATMGWSGSKIITNFLAQTVTPQGYVYLHGELIGKAEPTRPGWTAWGDEAAGPPFCPPRGTYEKGVLERARNGSVADNRDKRNVPVTGDEKSLKTER